MGRRLKVEEGFDAEDFLKAASEERDKRGYVRGMALHPVQQGKSAIRVGEQLCVHWRSVQEWVKRYKEKGLIGLWNQPGRGKKPMWSAAVGRTSSADDWPISGPERAADSPVRKPGGD